jgi:eukaryotic-like serine/threonine-protein kinase
MSEASSERAVESTVLGDMPPENVGSVIGPYKLLQQIGQGGFGVVYMAEQEKPVRRVVALKIIKPGMDTGQVIARFESERQALALMDHPNIARVLDAGATASGHPYFVMELVKGVPITDFCDKNHLTLAPRLKLFVDVCHAIQHAHHKGIIHRDIKPTNVMVTLHDGVPVVKVIDFGVAKATVQKLTERTLFTAYGQMVGTPIYMSPEQAEMSGLDIDTRSDVYSLGVLLYELLTGTTPLEAKRLREAGYAKIQKLIQEEEAPRPSTRLSSLGDTATIVAGNRGLDVKRLAQLLSGDLDWIVMKALDKDRDRRYPTPGSFAEDIERYLHDEAITARPPSGTYRLKKLIQRNKTAVITTALVALALLAGIGLATWQAVRATHAESEALVAANAAKAAAEREAKARDQAVLAASAERQAKNEALLAVQGEKKAKEEAVSREAESKAVLGFVEDRIFAAARPEGQEGGLGHDVTLRKAIESAVPYVGKSFTAQPLVEARLRMTLARSSFLLGETQMSLEQAAAARALYARYKGPDSPDTLSSMDALAIAHSMLGHYQDSLKLDEETLARRTARLGTEHVDTLRSMTLVANDYRDLRRYADAARLCEKTLDLQRSKLGLDHPHTLETMHLLATSYGHLGRLPEGVKLEEETLARRKARLGLKSRDTLQSMLELQLFYSRAGRFDDEIKQCEETIGILKAEFGPSHPYTVWCMNALAVAYAHADRVDDAVKLLEKAIALAAAKPGSNDTDTLIRMSNLAEFYERLDRDVEALKLREAALAARKKTPSSDQLHTLIAMSNVTRSLIKLRRGVEALPITQQAIAKLEKLPLKDPDDLCKAAEIHANAAPVFRATKQPAEAAREADRAMERLKQAVAAGYNDFGSLKSDTDLDSLRGRDDFKKLLTELQPASPTDQAKP